MLCFLSGLSCYFSPLRLFDYVTFRAGGAFVSAFLFVLLLGGFTARTLKKFDAASANRLEGLVDGKFANHQKDRTPCMGGILLIGGAVISSLFWTDLTGIISPVLIGSVTILSLLGFADDYVKVAKRNRDGVSGKLKLLVQGIVAALAIWLLSFSPDFGKVLPQLMIPFVKVPVCYGWPAYLLAWITVIGASNAVNLTDGKDGLATGCTISCTIVYATFAYLMGHKIFAGYLNIPYISGAEEAMVFASAICGACIGFLWHNCHPAAMFMGDTGSLALGGAVGLLAVLVRQEILLLLVGGVFVMEAGSVILQVGYFKLTHGKRIFKRTPIHHHFEQLGWHEDQIVIRFWILSGVFGLLALSTLKLR
ncbi:MAG: phospho-N-acetylmuramoyl-pentapeptide-transferase [Victivallaceae bacterium]|nr:phospho-N-acetylmuramoyl-pentapeptide-transferase [Victivallaceae bacterium]